MFKTNFCLLSRFTTNLKVHRYKHKDNHWSIQRKNKSGTTRALEHFDEFYNSIYKKSWVAIRKALLGKQKYVAVLNNYSDTDKTMKFLQAKGAIDVRTIFNLEKEHLQSERTKLKRQEALQQVWKSVEDSSTSETHQKPAEGEKSRPNFSLKQSLDDARLDFSRLIDGRNASSILYEFVPTSRRKGRENFIPEPQHVAVDDEDRTNVAEFVRIERDSIHFPECLHVFCFEEENFNNFPQPRRGSTDVLNYYLLDGASVLPVLALDLKPGSRVLDMCAAPGGKSLIALQTLLPAFVHCNDVSLSRTRRIASVMQQYLYDFQERWLDAGKVYVGYEDARYLNVPQTPDSGFDRVLVDAPCTTDRHSVSEDDNNIFRPDRVKERLQLPEVQTQLLMHALRIVRVGGIVVYSTCSLSPIQNEGVVQMALKRLWEETNIKVVIKDLNQSLRQFRNIYHFSSPRVTRYGHLVLPSTVQNYGPMYFCKLQRVK